MQEFLLLDTNVLDRLKADVGDESATFLINSLKTEIASNAEALEKFLAENDLEQLEIQAHALKSAARSFGALRLGEACYTLETGAKSGATHEVLEGNMTQFKDICAQTLEAFDEL